MPGAARIAPMSNRRRWLRASLGRTIVAVAGWSATACGPFSGAGNRPVSAETLARLEAGSAAPEDLALRRSGSGFVMRAAWSAPPVLETGLEMGASLPHLRCRINGRAARFIVDTGSTVSVLEADTALRCAVRTLRRSEGSFTLSGITGEEEVLVGVPERVEIEDWRWSGMPFLVRTSRSRVPGPSLLEGGGLAVNVIGMDVLRRMCSHVTLDYPRARVTFGFRRHFEPDPARRAWHVPMVFREGLPQVRVGEGGRSWWAIVDTGCAGAVEIDWATVERLGLRAEAAPASLRRVGVGSSNHAAGRPAGIVRLESLEMLGPRLLRVPALVVHDSSKIGSGLFGPFRVTLDFRRSRLWLESSG